MMIMMTTMMMMMMIMTIMIIIMMMMVLMMVLMMVILIMSGLAVADSITSFKEFAGGSIYPRVRPHATRQEKMKKKKRIKLL